MKRSAVFFNTLFIYLFMTDELVMSFTSHELKVRHIIVSYTCTHEVIGCSYYVCQIVPLALVGWLRNLLIVEGCTANE